MEVRRPVVGAREVPVERWSPPPSPFSKINVDVSWSNVSRLGFARVIIRDEGGRFLAATRYPFLAPNATAAEALALICGCELGISMGVSSTMIESDSLEAISCLRGSLDNGSWEAYPFLARALRLSESFQNCRWSWVPRSANMAADALVSAGFMEICDVVWVDKPPSSLVYVLCNDGLPCPH
ncbi:uncharacterized protein [Malus domestica]|uniref:uncharacterized protein n=1 Tax=Malus domestica TaxID=3750 RepID=UPI0007ECAA89